MTALLMLLLACMPGDITEREWELLREFALTPVPEAIDNPVADSLDAADLGQRLYFDRRFSRPLEVDSHLGAVGETGKVSCNDCHDVANGGADATATTPTSVGVAWTGRNAPSLYNAAYRDRWGWLGQHDRMWSQNTAPLEGAPHRLHPVEALELIHEDQGYDDQYGAIVGSLPGFTGSRDPAQPATAYYEALSVSDQTQVDDHFANLARIYEAYIRKLNMVDTPFDQFLDGDDSAISADALAGAKLFVGVAACNECHRGPMLTDDSFHNIGVSQVGLANVPRVDEGRACPTGMGASQGCFRTPSLRGVSLTAPYMHTGGLDTLWDVLDFYRFGGHTDGFTGMRDISMAPLPLTEIEIGQIVAFLESLEGQPPDEYLEAPPE